MNGDVEGARKLLAELRQAYRSLPYHAKNEVAQVLQRFSKEWAEDQKGL